MPATPSPTDDEMLLLAKSLAFNDSDLSFFRIKGSLREYPTVQMFSRKESSESTGWGKCYGDIDEKLETVFAWVWSWCSYERTEVHRTKHSDLVRRTNASDARRSQVVKTEYTIAPGIANRRSVIKLSWFKLESIEGGDAIVFESVTAARSAADEEISDEFTKSSVLATANGLFVFERVAPRITRMTLVQQAELGGAIPKFVMNSLIASSLSTVIEIQNKFRRVDSIVDKVSFWRNDLRFAKLCVLTDNRLPLFSGDARRLNPASIRPVKQREKAGL